MSNTPSQQAELYRKAAETIEMCAKHGIEPLCEVEGRPVYKGDELWNVPNNFKFKVDFIKVQQGELTIWSSIKNSNGQSGGWLSHMSWSQPKRTVMVELTVEDVAEWAKIKTLANTQAIYNRLGDASRKALDNLKA